MKHFVLISKDAMCKDYLPCYGNQMWNTPNINALAENGTVFTNYYSAAPSTVMAFYSMATGQFAHETKYEIYEKIHDVYAGDTIFKKMNRGGYEPHIIWDDLWDVLPKYFNYFIDDVTIHTLHQFRQGVGAHYLHDGFLKPDDELAETTFKMVASKIEEVLSSNKPVFLWIHFPHVIKGRVSYGSDIELFDRYVGFIRSLVGDENIAITADHGNMNGHKGKIGYAYDVYQPNINIPLITPRINGINICDDFLSSVDLFTLLLDKQVVKREFYYSDSAYRAQGHRKLAIIYDNYKYIYNKRTKKEELYDLRVDPTEEFSLIDDYVYDKDRKITAPSRELYYYHDWDRLPEIREILRNEKNRIWKDGSFKVVLKSNIKDLLRPLYEKISKVKS